MTRRQKFDVALVVGLVAGGLILYPWGRRRYHLWLLSSPNFEQALDSQKALQDEGRAAVPALVRFVEGTASTQPRRLALEALLPLHGGRLAVADPGVLDMALAIGAADWDQEAQSFVVQRLSSAEVPEARPLLHKLLDHSDPTIRQDAVRGLARYGNPADVAVIAARLDDAHLPVALQASLAVSRLSGVPLSLPRGDTPEDAAARERAIREWRTAYDATPQAATGPAPASPPYVTLRPLAPPPMAPDFELQDLDGRTVRLADFRGKPVLLNFWASWCVPCMREIPDLVALAGENDEFVILGLTAEHMNDAPAERELVKMGVLEEPEGGGHHHGGNDHPPEIMAKLREVQEAAIRKAVQEFAIPYPVLMADRAMMETLDAYSVPTTIVVRPDGRIHRRIVGERPGAYFGRVLREAAS